MTLVHFHGGGGGGGGGFCSFWKGKDPFAFPVKEDVGLWDVGDLDIKLCKKYAVPGRLQHDPTVEKWPIVVEGEAP